MDDGVYNVFTRISLLLLHNIRYVVIISGSRIFNPPLPLTHGAPALYVPTYNVCVREIFVSSPIANTAAAPMHVVLPHRPYNVIIILYYIANTFISRMPIYICYYIYYSAEILLSSSPPSPPLTPQLWRVVVCITRTGIDYAQRSFSDVPNILYRKPYIILLLLLCHSIVLRYARRTRGLFERTLRPYLYIIYIYIIYILCIIFSRV